MMEKVGNTAFQASNVDEQDNKQASRLFQKLPEWRHYVNKVIAAEISAFARYYNRVIQVEPRQEDTGLLLESIDSPLCTSVDEISAIPDLTKENAERTILLLNGNLNHQHDIQGFLTSIREKVSRTTRVVAVVYNPYFAFLYRFANKFGIRKGIEPDTFITESDLRTIAALSKFELVKVRPACYCPWKLGGVGTFLNKILPAIPVLRWASLTAITVLRPVVKETRKPSFTIIIPARNERGNIENALKRLPDFGGAEVEVIYVEGHSSDNTWEEIQRVMPLYQDRIKLSAYQQTGKGKSDAVRLGFSKAKNELLTILDADLTMPPELLTRFYDAYCEGYGDFINGSRLVYPMEGEAMRFLNHLGNVFFAKAVSIVLGTKLGDTLCGTKLVTRYDYERMIQWRNDFGDFDPFGDFELLFPASVLSLGVIDIAIRYRDRTYGSTNISRFRHGLMLLKMTAIGLVKIKTGAKVAD